MTAARLPHPYRPEAEVLAERLARLEGAPDWSAVMREATPWVGAVRRHPPPFWAMERLLREYPLSSAEGLALMRLAEALLRVPDTETAIALTADQLAQADFHVASDTPLARLSGTVLGLAREWLPAGGVAAGPWERLGARSVVAAALRAVQLLGHQFVLGEDIERALRRGARDGGLYSFDMLGEGARTAADAARHLTAYTDALAAIAVRADSARGPRHNDGLSIKLSALHPRYEDAQRGRVLAELVPRAWSLCERAAAAGLPLTLDAEESDRLELSLDVFEALAHRVRDTCPQWAGLGLAIQAYQTRALEVVEVVAGLARGLGLRLMCRLVKGAYWDTEVKRAQELGLPHYPVFTQRAHTDVSYLACARALLDAGEALFPQFATHNAATIAAVIQQAGDRPFELQRLHGMGEGLYREALPAAGRPCRIYAPVGRHRDLLAYLVRRLLENGANSSFVHQLADPSVTAPALLASPMAHARAWLAAPAADLPLPPDLLGERRNSSGLDLAVHAMREPLLAAWTDARVPAVEPAEPGQVAAALARARDAFGAWDGTPVTRRAQVLRDAADAMQRQLPRLAAVLVREGGKTWGDAVAEVREAVDYLRYYAQEAERVMTPRALPAPTGESNELRLCGRGPWACISPWNFPLAIFTGQLAAALATGNTVLAKPAAQTPGIARIAVDLLHAAGVPRDALQLLHGPGGSLGAALVAAPGLAGVAFTGSTGVARTIQRALAAREGPILPLIAETGGVNAMLVDSSALPEQVADAVVQSAFRSAGQRCSALRLLLLHEAIADEVIAMVAGAAAELHTGDPAQMSTDIGPVIDAAACRGLRAHIDRLQAGARLLYAPPPVPAGPPWLVGPHLFEVPDIAAATEEIFGPVLQVARWRGDPGAVVDQVNALGWGLTLGLQTRIDSRARSLAARARVGNVYVNRAMTGAVVGLQPFGGEGLSGTGPKAGGPHYLPRFCVERTVSVNTAAAGGNAALMARGA